MSPPVVPQAGKRTGMVVGFDDHVGLGEVDAGDGCRHPFHCTQIAGGTRTVAPGTAVTYELRPAHRGRWEAVEVTPVAGAVPPAGPAVGDQAQAGGDAGSLATST